jgi:hypothetical protein
MTPGRVAVVKRPLASVNRESFCEMCVRCAEGILAVGLSPAALFSPLSSLTNEAGFSVIIAKVDLCAGPQRVCRAAQVAVELCGTVPAVP